MSRLTRWTRSPAPTGRGNPCADHRATPAIRRLFVANRGEIAARIRRTCDRLGIVAIVPKTDGPDALDLLDIVAVVGAAQRPAPTPSIPGFGFLAENAAFAEAVDAAGIRWIGPPPAAIRAMGDKAAARQLARRLGIPTIDGLRRRRPDGRGADPGRASGSATRSSSSRRPAAAARGCGPSATPDDLADALAAARREAPWRSATSGSILERFLDGPRHVEVQVLFDGHGHGVHLGERDCSLQRRHQKVLEETPSPAVAGGDPRAAGRCGADPRGARSATSARGRASSCSTTRATSTSSR